MMSTCRKNHFWSQIKPTSLYLRTWAEKVVWENKQCVFVSTSSETLTAGTHSALHSDGCTYLFIYLPIHLSVQTKANVFPRCVMRVNSRTGDLFTYSVSSPCSGVMKADSWTLVWVCASVCLCVEYVLLCRVCVGVCWVCEQAVVHLQDFVPLGYYSSLPLSPYSLNWATKHSLHTSIYLPLICQYPLHNTHRPYEEKTQAFLRFYQKIDWDRERETDRQSNESFGIWDVMFATWPGLPCKRGLWYQWDFSWLNNRRN